MEAALKFRLLFEGEIPPRQKASLGIVHEIRRSLHPQLKQLWEHEPLVDLKKDWLLPVGTEGKSYARIENVGGKNFSPVIGLHMGAVLEIVLLRQQAPGQLIGEGGDIDNRMKTLFDAMRMPSKSEVQQLGSEVGDEDPIHCLLQDDSLIHRVDVETDRLLRPAKRHELVAVIGVRVVVTRATWGTIGLAGD